MSPKPCPVSYTHIILVSSALLALLLKPIVTTSPHSYQPKGYYPGQGINSSYSHPAERKLEIWLVPWRVFWCFCCLIVLLQEISAREVRSRHIAHLYWSWQSPVLLVGWSASLVVVFQSVWGEGGHVSLQC